MKDTMKERSVNGVFCQRKFVLVIFATLVLLYLYSTVLTVPAWGSGSLKSLQSIYSTVFNGNSPDVSEEYNYVELNLESLNHTDPQLIKYIRIRHLTPPSTKPYNLNGTQKRDTFSSWVAIFFKNKRGGRFIEAGANSGERGSHTLFLEKELGWSGLLVECNPTVVPFLRSKHRKAWIADVCLSPTSHPAVLNFSYPTEWTYSGTLGKPWNLPKNRSWTIFDVQTIPFYSLLAALGWTEVDYFCFDIQGQELGVLRNFPFNLFTFKVIIMEDIFNTKEQQKELKELLESNGYIFVERIQVDNIYVHKSIANLIPTKFF